MISIYIHKNIYIYTYWLAYEHLLCHLTWSLGFLLFPFFWGSEADEIQRFWVLRLWTTRFTVSAKKRGGGRDAFSLEPKVNRWNSVKQLIWYGTLYPIHHLTWVYAAQVQKFRPSWKKKASSLRLRRQVLRWRHGSLLSWSFFGGTATGDTVAVAKTLNAEEIPKWRHGASTGSCG